MVLRKGRCPLTKLNPFYFSLPYSPGIQVKQGTVCYQSLHNLLVQKQQIFCLIINFICIAAVIRTFKCIKMCIACITCNPNSLVILCCILLPIIFHLICILPYFYDTLKIVLYRILWKSGRRRKSLPYFFQLCYCSLSIFRTQIEGASKYCKTYLSY